MSLPRPAVVAVAVAAGASTLRRMRREFTGDGALSGPTVAAMYVLYATHAVGIVVAVARTRGSVLLPRAATALVGGLAAAAGTAMTVAGMSRFLSVRHVSGMDDEGLVTEGVYRYSRHPQYVGYTLVLAGVTTAARSAEAIAVAAAYPAVIAWWAPIEERRLVQEYGDEYRRYGRTTPRWLGLPRRHARR